MRYYTVQQDQNKVHENFCFFSSLLYLANAFPFVVLRTWTHHFDFLYCICILHLRFIYNRKPVLHLRKRTVCPGSSYPQEKIFYMFASENEVYAVFQLLHYFRLNIIRLQSKIILGHMNSIG